MGAFREWGGTFSDLERGLAHLPAPDPFTVEELDGLPQPVQQHFTTAIAADTPIATSARLRMKGQIKVKRWLPFRARQLLSPHHGFVWSGRAAGVIVGSDRYVDGHGVLDWKIAGLIPVAHADGSDISRSAAGRVGWFYGTDRWAEGEFFRFEIVDLELIR